jgi:hypothetical protein
VEHKVVLGVAIGAAVIGSIPLFAYLFVNDESWLNPYRSRGARWTVYLGGLLGLVALAWLSGSS